MAQILPTIIQGPVVIGHGGVYVYFQGAVTVRDVTRTWNPETSEGPMGPRFAGRHYEISGTPRGNITTALLDYFYDAYLSPDSLGKSIADGVLLIYSIADGKSYSFPVAGLSKPPSLNLSPLEQAFGPASWIAWGDVTKQPTDADFLKTVGTTASADTSFDHADVITDSYSLALGTTVASNPIGSLKGFRFDFEMETKIIEAADVGVADVILAGIGMSLSFIPSNLTVAAMDVLLMAQGASARLPGLPIGSETFTLTGLQSGWEFEAANMGLEKGDLSHQVGEHLFTELVGRSAQTWTTGVRAAMFAYTAPA